MPELIEGFVESDLLQALPSTVRESVKAIEHGGADWDAVGGLLAFAAPAGVALKGGGWRSDLWTAVKAEFKSFLCTSDDRYSDLRDEWGSLRARSKNIAVASLSGAIGAHLGVAAGIVSPLVVWLLLVTLRIGREGLCKALPAGIETQVNSG